MNKRNAFYAQAGGVTAVINATACGVIETARKHKDQIGKVYAGHNGIIGALTEDLIDTSKESAKAIAALRHTPGGAFGSCRYDLDPLEKNRAQYERLIEVFSAHNIGYFFYNGGGGSADTCLKVARLAKELGYPIRAIHLPKTVDNDLPMTDSSPGYGSVAKYIATSVREATLDLASMAETSTRVLVVEVMGRHAGWIAAAGGMASSEACELPIVILFAEIPFNRAQFLNKVRTTVKRHGYCTVVVSEGLKNEDGRFLSEQRHDKVFGHEQLGGVGPLLAHLIHQELGYKLHWAVPDYLQRSARHIASKNDVAQAYALGCAAVELALQGKHAVMPAIKRLSDQPYRWEIVTTPLHKVANVEKMLPRRFITTDGYGITQACRRYLAPLIEGEDYPPYQRGLPQYIQLKNVKVAKKLAAFEL